MAGLNWGDFPFFFNSHQLWLLKDNCEFDNDRYHYHTAIYCSACGKIGVSRGKTPAGIPVGPHHQAIFKWYAVGPFTEACHRNV